MLASFQTVLLVVKCFGCCLLYGANGNTLASRVADLESGIEESVSETYDGVRQHGDGVASAAMQPRRGEALRAPFGRKDEHYKDRLIRRIRPDGSIISLTYDADGNQVRKVLLDPTDALVRSTSYLVDVNNHTGYAQLVEEWENEGSGFELSATYLYGHDLISQSRPSPGTQTWLPTGTSTTATAASSDWRTFQAR